MIFNFAVFIVLVDLSQALNVFRKTLRGNVPGNLLCYEVMHHRRCEENSFRIDLVHASHVTRQIAKAHLF